jgi:hypothetical protein
MKRINIQNYKELVEYWYQKENQHMYGDELLLQLGFNSVKFQPNHYPDSWIMSNKDYFWFMLRWS